MHSKIATDDILKTWQVLPEDKKSKALVVLMMIIFGTILEMLSVGLVLPLLATLSSSMGGEESNISARLSILLNINDESSMLVFFLLVVIFAYGLKNIYLSALAWIQSKFVFDTQADLSQELLESYINQPYIFHLQKNTAELVNNLQVELNLFIVYLLNPGLLLIAELLVVIGLVVLLLFFEPIGTICIVLFFIFFGLIFQLLTKNRVSRWGKRRQSQESQRMKHAQQGLSAVKEVKLYNKESFFVSRYASHTVGSLSMNQRSSFIHSLTRLWLEILAILGIVMLFGVMYLQGKSNADILPVVGLFAAVSFRLLPSINRIMGALNQLRFGSTVVNLIHQEFKISRAKTNPNQNKKYTKKSEWRFKNQIVLKNVSFLYPNSTIPALSNINLTIKKGEMIGFIGESGSGKSTLIDLIMALLEPQDGEFFVDNENIKTITQEWQSVIGYVPQSIYITDDTLKNNIAFGVPDNEVDNIALYQALKAAQLETLVAELPDGIDTVLGEHGDRLSGGQRQRIGIARALYNNPDVLILDEATSALDSDTEKEVMSAIYKLHYDKTILIIAHRLSTIEKCDTVYRLSNGKLEHKEFNN